MGGYLNQSWKQTRIDQEKNRKAEGARSCEQTKVSGGDSIAWVVLMGLMGLQKQQEHCSPNAKALSAVNTD